jgi:hypothetical protein
VRTRVRKSSVLPCKTAARSEGRGFFTELQQSVMAPATWFQRLLASLIITFFIFCTVPSVDYIYQDSMLPAKELFEENNFGNNLNVLLKVNRQQNALESEMRYILHWNEAYGDKQFVFGLGREPFYQHRCPETRCVTTEDRKVGRNYTVKSALPNPTFFIKGQ